MKEFVNFSPTLDPGEAQASGAEVSATSPTAEQSELAKHGAAVFAAGHGEFLEYAISSSHAERMASGEKSENDSVSEDEKSSNDLYEPGRPEYLDQNRL